MELKKGNDFVRETAYIVCFRYLVRKNEYVSFNKEKCISPVYSKNIQEYVKIFFATLFRLANNQNQTFVPNACKNFDFSLKEKIHKNFSSKNCKRLINKYIFFICLLLL